MFHSHTGSVRCGVDEAGRGSVLGPLVVGAVYSDSDDDLVRMGVKDSKKLTAAAREHLFELITKKYEVSAVIISASEIDEKRKAMSLNDIESDMFVKACSKLPISEAYADCPDVNEIGFSTEMCRKLKGPRVIARHKADDIFPIVSAASIIAKVTRDRMITDIKRELGTNIGSGYPSDHYTMEFIEKWIKDNGCPPPYTRCSWEPVRNLMTLSKNTKISDW